MPDKNTLLASAVAAERRDRAKHADELARRREERRKELEKLVREEESRRRGRRLAAL